MNFNEGLAKKNKAEKLEISGDSWAWVLPEIQDSRKMIAYARNNKLVWVHPEYKDEQVNKKQKQKRQKTS